MKQNEAKRSEKSMPKTEAKWSETKRKEDIIIFSFANSKTKRKTSETVFVLLRKLRSENGHPTVVMLYSVRSGQSSPKYHIYTTHSVLYEYASRCRCRCNKSPQVNYTWRWCRNRLRHWLLSYWVPACDSWQRLYILVFYLLNVKAP